MHFSAWAPAQKIDEVAGNSAELNTSALDGCPIQSPDGLSLYMASNRTGGQGLLDIWVATRASTDDPWGAPLNLTAVNTASDEFCPTPVRGGGLFFVSRKVVAGVTCGLGDIYFTRFNPKHGWSEPQHLACAPDGPNTALDEQGPSRVEIDGTEYLYFSSSRAAAQPGGLVTGDIYVSERLGDGFGPATAVAGLNDAGANDIQPNVRKDGLELVFSSNRRRWTGPPGHLGVDTRQHERSVVGAGEPWKHRQHERGRDTALALLARRPAPVRQAGPELRRRRRHGHDRHLRHDSRQARRRWELMTGRTRGTITVLVAVVALAVAGLASATWGAAQKIDTTAGNHADINTPAQDGCPIQSPDGLSLYIASNRPGGKGGLDIWVATRASATAPWGAPQNLGEPVNSAADDFCPTPVGRSGLFFVSREALPGACGQGDIYFTHRTAGGTWVEPERLLCAPAGPNSELDEQGPSWVDVSGKLRGPKQLYFSRSSASPAVAGEIFMSSRENGARFGPAAAVAALNDGAANDIQPNVRADGLEVVFSSNRAGGAGGQDIWAATRAALGDPWSAPVNLGAVVNTGAGESRPSLSRDGKQLLFGRAPGPEGSGDIYVTTRP
jgi:hypothetical protein